MRPLTAGETQRLRDEFMVDFTYLRFMENITKKWATKVAQWEL